jgi:hypothetical protein
VLTGIDHVVIAVADPDAAAAELEAAVGLRASGGGRHEALGTVNRLIWFGDSYVELLGIADPTRAGASWLGIPTLRALDASGGAPTLVTFAVASDQLEADIAHLRGRLAAEWHGPSRGERIRPDGRVVRWRLAYPPAVGPDEPPFIIEHDVTAAEWSPEERAERAAEIHPLGAPVRLEVIEIPVGEVRRVSDRYLRALGLAFRPSITGFRARDTSIGPHTVRLQLAAWRRDQRTGTMTRSRPVLRLRAAGVTPRVVDAVGALWMIRGS